MKLVKLLSLVPFFLTSYAQDLSIANVKQAFEDANVIPGDLNINFNPQFLLEVVLPQATGLPVLVHTGIQLPRNDTANPPVFSLIDPSHPLVDAGPGPFVIATVDPDAPTPTDPTNAQVRHFLGGDFVVGNLPPLLSNTSAAVSDWRQPTPVGGNHRYVFLAFKQPVGFDQQTFVTPTTIISNFNISQFAQEVGLGDPIAGTFMMVAAPDSA